MPFEEKRKDKTMAVSLKVISSMATRRILESLIERFARQHQRTVVLSAMGGVDAARQLRNGADADVVVLASSAIAQLEVEGHVVAGSAKDIACSAIALAIPSGSPRPAIAGAADVKAAMLAAKSICYSTGPSGDHLKQLWQRWGLMNEMTSRAIQAPAGVPVGAMLARGEADLGIQQLSELRDMPGVDVVGLLPPEIQAITVFTAALVPSSIAAGDARHFIGYLASHETAEVKRRLGMESPD